MFGAVKPSTQDVSAGSTDALCRAVKRLHTCSSLTSTEQVGSASTAADERSLEQEASSPLAQGAVAPEKNSQLASDFRSTLKPTQDSEQTRSQSVERRQQKPHNSDDNRQHPSTDTTPLSESSKPCLESDSRPRSHLRLDLNSLQEKLEQENQSRSSSSAGNDSVAEPSTPVQEEVSSPAKGYRLGTLSSDPPKSDNYVLLYEEANMMLKNLHFARLHRHGQKAPS